LAAAPIYRAAATPGIAEIIAVCDASCAALTIALDLRRSSSAHAGREHRF